MTEAEESPPEADEEVTTPQAEETIELSILEQLQTELGDYKEKYLRLLAEGENQRKRLTKDREDSIRHAVADVILEFLKPIDHMEEALKHADNTTPEVKNWAIGFQMILGQFRDALDSFGIKPINAVGNPFDPHLHEAVEMVETNSKPEGTVVEEMLRGYSMGDRTLRASRVKVAKAPGKPQEVTKENQSEEEGG